MRVDVAVGLFGAYGAILSIIALHQTLALQAVVDRAERAATDFADLGSRLKVTEKRRERANWIVVQRLVFIVLVTGAFLMVPSYSDAVAARVDPADAPGWAFNYPTWTLRGLFLA